MRRIVLYDDWQRRGKVANSGTRQRNKILEGWFHCWTTEEDLPVAIVELYDGSVELWPADFTAFDVIQTENKIEHKDDDEIPCDACGQMFALEGDSTCPHCGAISELVPCPNCKTPCLPGEDCPNCGEAIEKEGL